MDKELREEKEKHNIKQDEEIEGFIRKRAEQLEKGAILKKISEILFLVQETKSNSAEMVREDRDNN